jgi:influenza virus NS1A-binding protein
VIGGFDGEQALGKVWAFYPGSATWRRVASMNQPRRRPLAGAAGGRLIVVGGLDSEVYTAEAYDPQTNQWSFISPPPVVLNNGADCTCNGKFYLLGGEIGEAASDAAYVYDPALDSWTPISRMQEGRFADEADLLDGSIVVAGGAVRVFTPTADAEALDLDCADELVRRPDEFGTRPDLDNPDDDEADDKDEGDDEGCCGC